MPRRIICNSEAVKACIVGYGVPADKIVPIPAFSRQYLEFTRELPARGARGFLRPLPDGRLHLRPHAAAVLSRDADRRDGARDAAPRRRRPGDVRRHQPRRRGRVASGAGGDPRACGVQDRICLVDDLDHDAFLTALQRSALYLRTPITDGVASSVLESLALGVPVVACENGTRPPAWSPIPPTTRGAMAAAVEHVIDQRERGGARRWRRSRCPIPSTTRSRS